MTRQLEISKKKELWFLFGGKPVRLSLREFKIVTGLRCGKNTSKPQVGRTPYYFTLFGREKNVTLERVLEILNLKSTTDREMRSTLCLPTSQNSKIREEHADMVENLENFLAYPWGRLSFEALVSSIRERNTWELAFTCVAVNLGNARCLDETEEVEVESIIRAECLRIT